MTISTIRVRTVTGAFEALEGLAKGNVRFRGHRSAKWRLGSTLSRHFIAPPGPTTSLEIDRMIGEFIFNLTSVGIRLPFDGQDNRARLEYARHYGLPSPLIDFTFSPYVALFFAFNGVRPHEPRTNDYSAIYCLNLMALADLWAHDETKKLDGRIDGKEYAKVHNRFKFDSGMRFEDGYPINALDYLELPASWNRRMQRQRGVFLYDTLQYKARGFLDLDDFLARQEINADGPKILTKVLIPHKVGREIMERLEIMAVTATLLFESHEGAVADVVNGFNYGRRTGRAWDFS
jgi:hypothetical protein